MRKFLLSILALLLFIGYVHAQECKMSPYTQLFLLQRAHGNKSCAQQIRRVKGVETINAFMRLNEGCNADEIRQAGVHIVNDFGKVMTVTLPVDKIEEISHLSSVKSINIGKPVKLANDSSRIYTNVDKLQAGTSLAQQYTGKGVIVGVIDLGIEFNHINFKDADGNSRVKEAFIYDTLYTAPSKIAQLTTDYTLHYHGTHVTGIAAGSYTKNGLQGMAPDADLLLSGSSLENTTITNVAKTMTDYADSVGKPIVINCSWCVNGGPQDGTSDMNVAIESLKKPGHIFVFSAGNEGNLQMYIRHISTNDVNIPQFKTVLYTKNGCFNSELDLWNRSSHKFSVRLAVVDSLGNELASTKLYNDTVTLAKKYYASDYDTTSLAKFYSGYIDATSCHAGNDRYNNHLYLSLEPTSANLNYHLALMVYTQKGDTIDAWDIDNSTDMISAGIPGYTSGDGTGSIGEECCIDNAISVGSYVTRNFATSLFLGMTLAPEGIWPHGDISYYSSFGIDYYGVPHPDITAPGQIILSSFNKYDTNNTDWGYITNKSTENGEDYYWAGCAGTSMSAPCVTGIIAQWMQYKPDLSVEEIRSIFRNTAIRDSFVVNDNQVRWGAGKIDAYAGLKYLLTTNIGNPQYAQHQVLIYPSSESGKINVYAQGETGSLRVNVYSVGGIKVYTDTVSTVNGSATIDLGSRFAKGIYIVKVQGAKAKGSNTLTVR